MSDSVDTGKRRFLTTLTSVTGGIAVVGMAYPFLASMAPSARAQAAGAPVEVDISKIQPGQMIVELWRKQPVWILRRTPQNLEDLAKVQAYLSDPTSDKSKQPEYAKNQYRSRKPEYLVMIGICTHLGCSPKLRPEVGAADLGGSAWMGGFFCPCHGSRFDLAGRVYKGSPAPINLAIPPYRYINDSTILIGDDTGAKA
ncbi:MAG: ubiquinol-cytochrome c reductase iron-sulfur subunit [Gammaproteobacteria bacterium]|nr:ubiquinol-cytochrome c reductase iron-sulfur subunit [Gammaproteobacteria bacterium]